MLQTHTYKTHLKTTITFVIATMITGCISLGPPPPSANYPEKIAHVPAAKALSQGIKIDADDHFDDQHDIDDALEGSNKIVIPAFKIHLVINDSAEARVSGTESTSFGGRTTKTSGASASMRVHLSGLNDKQLQAIADAAYADLVAQLQAAGREVVSAQDMRATLGYKSIEFAEPSGDAIITKGIFNSGDNKTYLDIPAAGLPLWYIDFFSNNNAKSFNFLSSELKAVALIPTITVTFVSMKTSGRGSAFFGGGTADVGAELGIRLINVEYNGTLAENAMGGEMGLYVLRVGHDDPIVVSGDFAKLTKASSSKSGSFLGSDVVSKSDYVAKANPKKFKKLVLQGIQAANKAFADFTKEHRP